MNGFQLRAMLCGSFLFTSVGLAQADPPASIKVGEKYTETQMEKLVSYKVEEGLTIFVKTEYGHLNYGKPVNNDLFLISEISAPPRKSLGEAIGMVRLQTGQVAYLKTVDCEYFEKNTSSENKETYRLFDCELKPNPRAYGGKPMKVLRSIDGSISFQ